MFCTDIKRARAEAKFDPLQLKTIHYLSLTKNDNIFLLLNFKSATVLQIEAKGKKKYKTT